MRKRTEPTQTPDLPRGSEDSRIATDVVRVLEASGRFLSGQLEVLTSGEEVKLRGRVGSYYQKQLAQCAALSVIGDRRRLVNEIEVT